jgi:hypothetical protein
MNIADLEFGPGQDAMTAAVELVNLTRPIEVCMANGLSLAQERIVRNTLSEFITAWPDLEPALRNSVFAYYQGTRDAVTDCGPVITSEEQIWTHADLHSLRVPEILPDGRFCSFAR